MVTEFQVINQVVRISKEKYPDEVMVIYKDDGGCCNFCLESEYIGKEEQICGRYLNGGLAPE